MVDTAGGSGHLRVPIEAQKVDAPLTGAAVFLVLTIDDAPEAMDTVRSVLSDLSGLTKTVGFRDLSANLSCTVGIGSDVWEALTGARPPQELRPFTEIRGAVHTAPATPGDLLFHIRSDRRDLCFEFERLLLAALGDAVAVADETVGFRYFDVRDLLGFVDGTANPVGPQIDESTLVGEEDADYAGGSYVVVQKYVHPLESWQALTAEQQEAIIGRTKADGVELDGAVAGQKSHKTLATIVDDAGVEHDILRDNMPFGSPGSGEFGTYFIGYSKNLWVTQRMLDRMFIGDPPGLHDRLLDFSTAVTGSVFFAPAVALLDGLGDVADAASAPASASTEPPAAPVTPAAPDDVSRGLGLGSLR